MTITISEAIKILQALKDYQYKIMRGDRDDALQLSIEALKCEKGQRAMGLPSPIVLLPGERKE